MNLERSVSPPTQAPQAQAALSIHNLRLSVASKGAFASSLSRQVLVDNICMQVQAGQCLAVVGESGSGKSLTALSCARLLADGIAIDAGDVWVGNGGARCNVMDLPRSALHTVRGKRLGFVFQEPSLALNPVLTVGEQLREALCLHRTLSVAQLNAAATLALEQVGIEHAALRLNDYPLQFSGGQKQRIMIAMALAGEPDVLIADEPTTALDVLVQAQILQLLKQLQIQRGMALVLISHDLAIVKQMADTVVVMQAGVLVESQLAATFFAAPHHPHSQTLLGASRVQLSSQRSDPSAPLLLSVQDVHAAYASQKSIWRAPVMTPILHNISLTLKRGETLALVGASGSGKTTLAKVLLGLQDRNIRSSGHVELAGIVRAAHSKPTRTWQQAVSVVFQDPFASLNPRLRVGELVTEGVHSLRPEWSPQYTQAHIAQLMDAVGLPTDSLLRWPHEFSGGQRQRIAIVRALAVAPQLVVLDEPTSALDVTVQAKLLAVLADLQIRFGFSYLLITHNLHVVQAMAQHMAVLHEGRVVEYGETAQVLAAPQHAQTQKLLQALPRL